MWPFPYASHAEKSKPEPNNQLSSKTAILACVPSFIMFLFHYYVFRKPLD